MILRGVSLIEGTSCNQRHVEAKKPDDIVDEENSFRAKLAAQLVVNKKEQDIKDGEYVPPDHCGVGDLGDYVVI